LEVVVAEMFQRMEGNMRKSLTRTWVLGLGLAAALALSTAITRGAVVDAFLKIDTIRGESQAFGHQGWIDVQDVVVMTEGDVSRPYVLGKVYNGSEAVATNTNGNPQSHNPTSAPPGRAPGTPAHSPGYNSGTAQQKNPPAGALETGAKIISMVKKVDAVSPILRQAMTTGHIFASIVIEYTPQKSDGTLAYGSQGTNRIEITDAIIIALQQGSAGPASLEKIQIKSSKVMEKRL
jgi:type VI protein secretion system component Hcp